jgi:hypothetical protein
LVKENLYPDKRGVDARKSAHILLLLQLSNSQDVCSDKPYITEEIYQNHFA